jgi:O-methyltransferase
VPFIQSCGGFRLLAEEKDREDLAQEPGYCSHVLAIFEKSREESIVGRGRARLIPSSVRGAYRAGRLGLQLLRGLDASSVATLRDSLGVAATILRARQESILQVPRLKALHRLARVLDREGVEGDFVECGVYRGGSAAILGHALRDLTLPRQLWLFDSFQGLPRPTEADRPSAPALEKSFVGDERVVIRLLAKVGSPLDRVQIIPGWFHETFPMAPVRRVALLHIDAGRYEYIRLCLERFFDALEPGAIVVLDDYDGWPGCKAALDDFAAARALKIELQRTGEDAPYFRKPH